MSTCAFPLEGASLFVFRLSTRRVLHPLALSPAEGWGLRVRAVCACPPLERPPQEGGF